MKKKSWRNPKSSRALVTLSKPPRPLMWRWRLRPLPAGFLMVPYKGNGAKSTPVGAGCYKIFFNQLYHDNSSSPRVGKLEWTWRKLWTDERQSWERLLSNLSTWSQPKIPFTCEAQGTTCEVQNLCFLMYVTLLLYRKVRIFQKNPVALKQQLMHAVGCRI